MTLENKFNQDFWDFDDFIKFVKMVVPENKFNLPEDHKPYTDKYFIRTKEILEKDNLNPWVKIQVFIRKGPGKIYGIEEAIAIIEKYSKLKEHGGHVYALEEGSDYDSKETLMIIEGPYLDFAELETMYLGVISAETTKRNDNVDINLDNIEERVKRLKDITKRPIVYMGARHWRYDKDKEISHTALKGGADDCSTNIGANTVDKTGVGTMPHALILIYGWKYGKERGTVEAAKAFDKYIDPGVKRIVLIDTFNREITDVKEVAKELGDKLYGIRIDTCGESLGEGCIEGNEKHVNSKGVTTALVYNLRKTLEEIGRSDVKIVASSGFASEEKCKRFIEWELENNKKTFDLTGVGQVFHSRAATADIVEIEGEKISKKGREYKPNEKLRKAW